MSDKVEIVKGKTPRGEAFDEIDSVPRRNPAYVGRHSRDRAFVAAIRGRRPGMCMVAVNFVEKYTRPVSRFLRRDPVLSICQTNRCSAFHWRLPNSVRAFRVEIDPMTIRRPEGIGSVWRSRGESLRRSSIHVHGVEFGIAGSA